MVHVQKREPDPEAPYVDHDAGPYHAARDGSLAKCSHFIIYQVTYPWSTKVAP